jgi:uncharacterized heparinase superfamily protein
MIKMNVWHQVERYWHTLKHLRLVQIYGRVWFKMWKPGLDLSPAPKCNTQFGSWCISAKRLSSMTGPRSWIFLNESGNLDELGWDGPQRNKLWRYNQHYFDDLNAHGAVNRLSWHLALLEDWIKHNPPGQGSGWEPYPLSVRVVNWLKWALGGGVLSSIALQSLAVQVRWLSNRLETHLLGNHLFTNAKALVAAGLFFDGQEADKWLAQGLRILSTEIHEQFLPDGGHFERSTMYHALALEDLIDLVNFTQCFVSRMSLAQQELVAEWPQRARGLYSWLRVMCHPDGEISMFNDAAFDVAASAEELEAYAERVLGEVVVATQSSIVHLEDSGYVRLNHGDAVALLDVAKVGPDYLPGHAHADTLSFELSLGAQRVLVNSGTSCYGQGAERLRQRGTASHNTVVVDGQDSSEVWGGFRVARRAYPVGLIIEQPYDSIYTKVHCAHNGYVRFNKQTKHHRTWYMNEHELTVVDKVEGPHQFAEARFHFHPTIKVQVDSSMIGGIASLPDGTVITWKLGNEQFRLESSTWHPKFGYIEPNVCLAVKLVNGCCSINFRWTSGNI